MNTAKNEFAFEIQGGEGTNIEIITDTDWIIITEDDLIKMIRMAFNAGNFTLDHLIEAIRNIEESE